MWLLYLLARVCYSLAVYARFGQTNESLNVVEIQSGYLLITLLLGWKFLGAPSKCRFNLNEESCSLGEIPKRIFVVLVVCCSISMLRFTYHFWEAGIDRAKTPCAVIVESLGMHYLAQNIFASRSWFVDRYDSCASWRTCFSSSSQYEIDRRMQAVADYYGEKSPHMARLYYRTGLMLEMTRNYPPEAVSWFTKSLAIYEESSVRSAEILDVRCQLAILETDPPKVQALTKQAALLLPIKEQTTESELSLHLFAYFAEKHGLPELHQLFVNEEQRMKSLPSPVSDNTYAMLLFILLIIGVGLHTGFALESVRLAYYSWLSLHYFKLSKDVVTSPNLEFHQRWISIEMRRGNIDAALRLSAKLLESMGVPSIFKPEEVQWKLNRSLTRLLLRELHAGLFIASFLFFWFV